AALALVLLHRRDPKTFATVEETWLFDQNGLDQTHCVTPVPQFHGALSLEIEFTQIGGQVMLANIVFYFRGICFFRHDNWDFDEMRNEKSGIPPPFRDTLSRCTEDDLTNVTKSD